ncbi:hypothetical protein ALQ37_200138 [Pseudomonas syringae pv. aptata]|uniref:Uncharacterized protein n=1 Tax=Pseudomonas syringae pv. aptata TaxID=83167 RepID=A0A3M3X7L8_PSEAP|nr:hypothetical protein [Pseudomonas syringae]RMO65403.1 hypothetical protein ALQ37_200138 [Pseudomonas syringae pv. aptata]
MKKVIGTASGGKSAFKADDGKFYDTSGRGHVNLRDANANIDAEIQHKESQGINTITGLDGIIILIVCLILLGFFGYGLNMFATSAPLKGVFTMVVSLLPIYPLYRFFFYSFFSTRIIVYIAVGALGLLVNWALAKYLNIYFL